jgi:cytochrome c oxidase subunit 2
MGERVAVLKGCMRCHTADGTPHIGPSWFGVYGAEVPLASAGLTRADEAYLTESMMDPRVKLRAGFLPVMPSYQGLLSAPEVGALLEYMRYLSTRTPATRLSPLAPRGAPPLLIPTQSPQPLERDVVPAPFGGGPLPRPDPPPFSPLGSDPSQLDLETP